MVVDFDELARIVRAHVIDELDHRHLNDTIENPTSENIVAWIWRRLEPQLPALDRTDALGNRRRLRDPPQRRSAPVTLQLAEIFYSVQGEGTLPVRRRRSCGWRVAISRARSAIPTTR